MCYLQIKYPVNGQAGPRAEGHSPVDSWPCILGRALALWSFWWKSLLCSCGEKEFLSPGHTCWHSLDNFSGRQFLPSVQKKRRVSCLLNSPLLTSSPITWDGKRVERRLVRKSQAWWDLCGSECKKALCVGSPTARLELWLTPLIFTTELSWQGYLSFPCSKSKRAEYASEGSDADGGEYVVM